MNTTLPLLTLSLTGPLTAHATAATKVTLACSHLIAAAIIIPVVTRRLAVAQPSTLQVSQSLQTSRTQGRWPAEPRTRER